MTVCLSGGVQEPTGNFTDLINDYVDHFLANGIVAASISCDVSYNSKEKEKKNMYTHSCWRHLPFH